MARQGRDLVRQVTREVADEQGGTERASADGAAANAAPEQIAASDIAGSNSDEGYGSQMGYPQGGEWNGREDPEDGGLGPC